MISVVYPYRNREPERVKRSLDSLLQQTNLNFKVVFVDYGSSEALASAIKQLISGYSFASYVYNFSEFQPWSRAKALNVGLRNSTTDYVFTADVDMIFSPTFITKLYELKDPLKAYYFKVGFLNEQESKANKVFENYSVDFSTGVGAQGLSFFSLKKLEAVNGYDEFLHFWGAEDIDIHNRLEKTGIESVFYSQEILLLHQWHKSYRKAEKPTLTKDLQLTNIIKVNHQQLLLNKRSEKVQVNNDKWGETISKADFEELRQYRKEQLLFNKVEVVTNFLFSELPKIQDEIVNVRFVKDSFEGSIKYKIKKLLGKNVPKYYSLKEINDMVLLHTISFYHTYPYTYEVTDDLKSITFKIKK